MKTVTITLTEKELINLTGAMRGRPADFEVASGLLNTLDQLMLNEFTLVPCPETDAVDLGYYIGVSAIDPTGSQIPAEVILEMCDEVDPPVECKSARVTFPTGKQFNTPVRLLALHQKVTFTPCSKEEYEKLVSEYSKPKTDRLSMPRQLERMAFEDAPLEVKARYEELKAKGKENCTPEECEEMRELIAAQAERLVQRIGNNEININNLLGGQAETGGGCGTEGCNCDNDVPTRQDTLNARELLDDEDKVALDKLVDAVNKGAPMTPELKAELERVELILSTKAKEIAADRMAQAADAKAPEEQLATAEA